MNAKTAFVATPQIGMEVEKMVKLAEMQRKSFERRWYNNNFFDDGYHYRYVSRTTGRVVDLSTTSDTFIPYRAIPKASRQLRGIANLLASNEWTPVIFPEKQLISNYQDQAVYDEAMTQARERAKKIGLWVQNVWRDYDLEELIIQMLLLTGKHGVSYMQIWPDPVKEDIQFKVYDAFDIYLKGELSSIYDSPFIVKSTPVTLSEIRANENFDTNAIAQVNPDNKYATSEIKEAYMLTRFGMQRQQEANATLILKEAFIKEYIGEENAGQVRSNLGELYGDRKTGDPVIRQVFSVAGVTLRDKYIDLPEYPFVDFRMEPGPIYQVPLIERFMQANKSLDSVMSRIERYIGTMVTGAWLKRRGESFKINNISGGQEIEYDTNAPVQASLSPIPGYVFSFINQLNSIIEEQGASTSALGNAPPGVKSGVAIESLKASEYANLKIATKQYKKTVQRIAQRMLELASKYFITPKTVNYLNNGIPQYFDIIGEKGMDTYKNLSKKKTTQVPNATVIKSDDMVEVEIESGLGYTEEGKRNTMIQIIDYMKALAKDGLVPPDAVALVVKRFLEVFQFGSMQEFMDAMSKGPPPVTDAQIQEMKLALLSVIKDLQGAQAQQANPQPMPGEPTPEGQAAPAQSAEDQEILKIKTGFMQAMSDLKNANNGQTQEGAV